MDLRHLKRLAKTRKINRRRFFAGMLLSAPLFAVGDAKWLEPSWVKTRKVRLHRGTAKARFVHFTDVHHKGDRAYLESVVKKINALSPEFVCFTGDLIEEAKHLPEALELIGKIKAPVYGVPGNHDYWSKASFEPFVKCFAGTSGGWLMDEQRVTADGKFTITGATCLSSRQPAISANASTQNIFLMHFPAWVKKVGKFDLLLAGHSHGGQVRLPFYGPIIVPYGVDEFDMGLFQTSSGPLYVNPGIGWFPVPIRFNCRPEITVFEI
jgi:predicted MPP superfamily phosphohydrolase